MLLLAQDNWSQAEVRKLIALIATEHLRAQAAFDALPVAVGVVATDLRVIWANQGFRDLLPAIQTASSGVREAVESAARTGAASYLTLTAGNVRLDICPSRYLDGEVVLLGRDDCPQSGKSFSQLEHCEVPVLVYDQLEGKLAFANSQAAELTGYQSDSLPHLQLHHLFPEHHQLLKSTGDRLATLRTAAGNFVSLKCSVREIDGAGLSCLTVLGPEPKADIYATNLSAVEGCLTGAFPDSTITRAFSAELPGQRFRIFTERHERVLTVTDAALRSPQLTGNLREIPEALNLTRSVMLTEAGVSVD